MGGFVSRWVVAQEHEIEAGDVDTEGFVADEALARWIAAACAAYVDHCAVLRQLAAGPGFALQVRPARSLEGVGARLGRSTTVVVSAGVNEFRPDSFTISLRVRSSGGDDDGVVNAACEVTVEDQAGVPRELGDAVRDELIALEHSASHIN